MNTTRHLYLVRHGLPDYSANLPADELPGPPLSDVGRHQARQSANFLHQLGPLPIYTSPLARTRTTANIIAAKLGISPLIDHDLREWHRTEKLYDVSGRLTTWLINWLRTDQPRAIAVSHGSPLLAILRSALYLPHLRWWHKDEPDRIDLDALDRFEFTMAAVFELEISPQSVTAHARFHPHPTHPCRRP